jgi:hypothetical protein
MINLLEDRLLDAEPSALQPIKENRSKTTPE